MRIGRALVGAGDGFVDRVLCVIGTIAFSQVPEFIQQYLQRLGGHLDEARQQVAQFEHVAEQSGLTLEHLIGQTSANADTAVSKLSVVINAAVARVDALSTAQSAIEHATLWERPFVFLRHMDPRIARATWSIFRPAVPTTVEGLIYAVAGMIVMLTFYHAAVKLPIRHAIRARQTRKAAQIV